MKSKVAFILSMMYVLTFFPQVGFAQNDYIISNLQELQTFRDNVNSGNNFSGKNVIMTASIDLTGISWRPIGTEAVPFAGTFDGGNNTISEMMISLNEEYAGFFGCTSGTVKNLTVSTSAGKLNQGSTGFRMFSGIVAAYNTGNIYNCTVNGDVNVYSEFSYAASGGICGMNTGSVDGCTSNAKMSVVCCADYTRLYADGYAGGICGINEGVITSSSSSNEVYAHSRFASAISGGAVGDNRGSVSGVTTTGSVIAHINFGIYMSYSYAGGICGSNTGTTENCSSSAKVESYQGAGNDIKRYDDSYAGGICGYSNKLISGCQFSGIAMAGARFNTLAYSYVGGICGYNRGEIKDSSFLESGIIRQSDSVFISPDYAGGIAGENRGKISKCTSAGNIIPKEEMEAYCYYGGIAGRNDGGSISLSSSSTNIIIGGNEYGTVSQTIYSGGITGENTGRIENSYYYGAGANNLKTGVCGGLSAINSGVFENCYVKAAVKPDLVFQADGLVVQNTGSTRYCYFYIASLPETVLGTKKGFAEMKDIATFTNWPFDIFWKMDSAINNGLPSLKTTAQIIAYSGGMGTVESPYLIGNETDLYNIRFSKNANFKLVSDITVSKQWIPIGSVKDAFVGKIEGNHHTIQLNNTDASLDYNGFIGYGKGCSITNLEIQAPNILRIEKNNGDSVVYAGGIMAYGENVAIENCIFSGEISASGGYIYCGGIGGFIDGTIIGCRTDAIVGGGFGITSHAAVGGIVGRLKGTLSECEANASISIGTISADGISEVGGMCGILIGTLRDSCFNGVIANASTQKTNYTGGLSGLNDGNLKNSYANADMMSLGENDGGVCAKRYNGNISTAFYNSALAHNNGNGNAVVEAFFSDTTSINGFRTFFGGQKYIWTIDKTTGRITLLHIKPQWITENGFTKCSFTSNSNTCQIYYTTDGSNPMQNGILYTTPFLCENMTNIKYYAKESGTVEATTGVFEYSQAAQSTYELQFLEIPVNQNGEKISANNIAQSTQITVKVVSKIDKLLNMYLAVYDDKGVLISTNCKAVDLKSGENQVTFSEINIKAGSAVQVLVWDNELCPYSQAVKL